MSTVAELELLPYCSTDPLRSLGSVVPVVSVAYFQDYLLPPLPGKAALIKQTFRQLRSNDLITPSKRWAHWPNNPCDIDDMDRRLGGGLLEDEIFRPLMTLVQDIQNAAVAARRSLDARECRFVVRCNPACVPISQSRREPSPTMPDAYVLLKGHKTPIKWSDIVVSGELKKTDSREDKLDNYQKILRSMCYIMREDARRSRSEVLASEEVNFMTDHITVIDFFLRISFAKNSYLGFDNTVTRLAQPSRADGSVRYEIEVRDSRQEQLVKTYRTVRLISELGALTPHSRGTRVWEVYEIDGNGKEVGAAKVLKDTWNHADHPSEGDNLASLSAKASAMGLGKQFKKHFISVSRHGDVYTGEGKSARLDTTATFRLSRRGRRAEIPPNSPTLQVINFKRLYYVHTCQGLVVMNVGEGKVTKHPRYPVKVHHRIVYDEVGKHIFQAKSLCVAFQCLLHVMQGLALMHQLGWVHRDISYGNVLLVGNECKITDLEYAREETDTSDCGNRTGTVYFMSTEVDAEGYLHAPPPVTKAGSHLAEVNAIHQLQSLPDSLYDDEPEEEDGSVADPILLRQDEEISFRYNAFHDLESAVWLGFYLVLAPRFRRYEEESTEKKEYNCAQDELFHNLFTIQKDRTILMALGTSSTVISRLFSGLHPRMARVVNLLMKMRTNLLWGFTRAEAQMTSKSPIPFAAANGVTFQMARLALVIAKFLKRKDLTILSEDDYKLRRPLWTQIMPRARSPGGVAPDAPGDATSDGERDSQSLHAKRPLHDSRSLPRQLGLFSSERGH